VNNVLDQITTENYEDYVDDAKAILGCQCLTRTWKGIEELCLLSGHAQRHFEGIDKNLRIAFKPVRYVSFFRHEKRINST